jgi:hypothetical protein
MWKRGVETNVNIARLWTLNLRLWTYSSPDGIRTRIAA